MNSEILDYIKILTKNDTKNLSQKLGKTMEETGELARAVLPFDGAAGTLHRFTDRTQILEESVDVVLTALSIAYQIGCTDQEIEEMMMHKSKKWGGLQSREQTLGSDPVPYEIHITVMTHESNIEEFKRACSDLKVKPIVIEMPLGDNGCLLDVMTSSVHMGDNRSAHDEMERISNGLADYSFEVIRKKIETVPWHPAAPQTPDSVMPTDCYFESHVAVTITGMYKEDVWEYVRSLAVRHGAHPSKNAFKQDNESITRMITLRTYKGDRNTFQAQLDDLVKDLDCLCTTQSNEQTRLTVNKVITEFSIYDTKVSHDAEWIGNNS